MLNWQNRLKSSSEMMFAPIQYAILCKIRAYIPLMLHQNCIIFVNYNFASFLTEMKRTYASGAQKRKRAAEEKGKLSKLSKLSAWFIPAATATAPDLDAASTLTSTPASTSSSDPQFQIHKLLLLLNY